MSLLALPLLALVLAACGGMKSGSSTGGAAGASTSLHARAAKSVVVEESEYKLVLSTMKFGTGTYTFVAKNVGKVAHGLEINGPGVSTLRIAGTIAPGQSKSLTVTLKRGTYELFCPVPGHKGLGMDTHISVGSAAAATPAPAPTSTSSSTGSAWG